MLSLQRHLSDWRQKSVRLFRVLFFIFIHFCVCFVEALAILGSAAGSVYSTDCVDSFFFDSAGFMLLSQMACDRKLVAVFFNPLINLKVITFAAVAPIVKQILIKHDYFSIQMSC